jgi:hypothetical protein
MPGYEILNNQRITLCKRRGKALRDKPPKPLNCGFASSKTTKELT